MVQAEEVVEQVAAPEVEEPVEMEGGLAAMAVPEAMVRVETAAVAVSAWVPIPAPVQVRAPVRLRALGQVQDLGRVRGLVRQRVRIMAMATGPATARATPVPVRPMEPDTEALQPISISPKGMQKGGRRPLFWFRVTVFSFERLS